MINRFLTFIAVSLISICSIAAQGQRKLMSKEEFRAKQQQYFIEKTGITEEEAAKFFPVYYELQDKKAAINNKAWHSMKKDKKQEMSEQEYSDIIEKFAQAKINSDKLDLEYIPKFKKIISAKKIFMLQAAEMKFHRDMLKNMHKPNNK